MTTFGRVAGNRRSGTPLPATGATRFVRSGKAKPKPDLLRDCSQLERNRTDIVPLAVLRVGQKVQRLDSSGVMNRSPSVRSRGIYAVSGGDIGPDEMFGNIIYLQKHSEAAGGIEPPYGALQAPA